MINLLRNLGYIFEPISMAMLNEINSQLGFKIPKDLQNLLLTSDGFFLSNTIKIFGSNDLVERNVTLEVKNYAPSYIAFADDSGPRCFLLNLNNGGVYSVDQGSMDPDDMTLEASSLEKWLTERLASK